MEPKKIRKDEKYKVKICSNCFKHEHKSKFVESTSVDESVLDKVQQRFKDAKNVDLYIPEHREGPGLTVEGEAVVDEKIVPIAVEYTLCPKCSQRYGQAYNGLLQLRNPTEEIKNFIEKEIDEGHAKGYFCTKEEEVTNGMDYRLTSAQFARNLGRKLQSRFGGELIETARLVSRSRQTSKDLYRTTVLFRVPEFKKGDIIRYKGKEVKVLNFGNRVYVQDLKTNKKQQVRYEDIKV